MSETEPEPEMMAFHEAMMMVFERYNHSTRRMLQALDSVDESEKDTRDLLRLALLVQAYRRCGKPEDIRQRINTIWNQLGEN